MPRLGTIRGIVRDADNLPREDVNVIILDGLEHPDLSAVTDEEGRFDLGGLQPGRYVIKAFAGNTESEDISIRVLSRKAAFVEIWLEMDIIDGM
jgi:hypothetical protein